MQTISSSLRESKIIPAFPIGINLQLDLSFSSERETTTKRETSTTDMQSQTRTVTHVVLTQIARQGKIE